MAHTEAHYKLKILFLALIVITLIFLTGNFITSYAVYGGSVSVSSSAAFDESQSLLDTDSKYDVLPDPDEEVSEVYEENQDVETVVTFTRRKNGPIQNFRLRGTVSTKDLSPTVVTTLISRGDITSNCVSLWECSDWRECRRDNLERRECVDLNDCLIPTEIPKVTQTCSFEERCVEDWSCTWSSCIEGEITPDCTDLNSCGTTYDRPEPFACEIEEAVSTSCEPSISCSEWSECASDYSFLDASPSLLLDLKGVQSRTCTDSNACQPESLQKRECLLSLDIYTEEKTWCGIPYTEIYRESDGVLLSQVTSAYDVILDPTFGVGECSHCSNGFLDKDEEAVDCGGADCGPCEIKYTPTTYKASQGFFTSLASEWGII